ncbi:tyrosine-type recombinase/integrase [Chengkuizengella sp. SCS-71B]|uniref:tyrosine-type recombinase/integrase n=1 Tax=Chengkuizengella sp. SCS-71B TaxID=3115290 RepID=UPI0032C248C3
MRFSDFVKEWEMKYAKKELAPSTLRTYKFNLTNHILPVFGHLQFDKIKPIHLVTFFDDLSKPGSRKDGREEPLSSGAIDAIHRAMRNVFKRAKEWQIIKKNIMVDIKKPKIEKTKMKFYDAEEAASVIKALYQEPLMWRLLIFTGMFGGLRRGEILGLEWNDVDFEERTLSINKNIPLTLNGEPVIEEPKTKSSKDIVKMPLWYMDELKKYKIEWDNQKESAEDLWVEKNYEFIFHGGQGKPIYYTYPSEWWTRFLNKNRLKKIRFHDLRHSCASLLIEENVPLKKIQEHLRHSMYQTTADIYTHITKKSKEDTADTFNKFSPEINEVK